MCQSDQVMQRAIKAVQRLERGVYIILDQTGKLHWSVSLRCRHCRITHIIAYKDDKTVDVIEWTN